MLESADHYEARIEPGQVEEEKLFLHRIRKLAPHEGSYSNVRSFETSTGTLLAPRWDCQQPRLVCTESGHDDKYGEAGYAGTQGSTMKKNLQ